MHGPFRVWTAWFALLALPAASGCGDGRCSVAGAGWPDEMPAMLPDQQDPSEELAIAESGRISWRGSQGADRDLSLAELEQLLPVIGQLNPRPWLIVSVSPQADCESVRAVKAALERQSFCAEGRCVEGHVWDRTFGP